MAEIPQSAMDRVRDARSFLFVPGNRPERFDKALGSGADAVILDLEDAVPVGEKAAAREAVLDAWPRLHEPGVPVVVRINPPESDLGAEDLRGLTELDRLAAVMVPKAESANALDQVRSTLGGVALLPLIESAAGYAVLAEIAAAEGVLRLVVGDIDFMADTGMQCGPDQTELTPLRFAIAMATRRSQLAPAVEGVTADFRDDVALRRDTERALRFGFGAKLCIHPRQVPVLHAAMAPGPEEIAWARQVLEVDAAAGGRAVQLDGKMIDRPVVLRARQLLAHVPDPVR